jgi:hypothetical protein
VSLLIAGNGVPPSWSEQATTGNYPTSGGIGPTYDINSDSVWSYYGVEGNDKRVQIMSIEKFTAKDDALQDAGKAPKQIRGAAAAPKDNLRVLSLEIADDDYGSDPYNRTGQFCQLELKDRD